MNEYRYNEISELVSKIPDFKKLVASESKRPIAVRLLMYLSDMDKREAIDFVNTYYNAMELNIKNVTINRPTK